MKQSFSGVRIRTRVLLDCMTDETSKRWVKVPAFVGREEAKRGLDAALDRALKFQSPQFVTLVGDSGMGKSRFLGHWTQAVAATETFRVVSVEVARPVDALPAESFGLVGDLLRARFGIDDSLDVNEALSRFRAELQSVFGDRRVAEVAALLGRFLGFSLPESPLSQALSARPEQELELGRAVLGRFLEEDANQRPLLLVIDDLHRADDASVDLLQSLLGELREAPLVVVAASQPELLVRRADWGRGAGSHSRLDLAPLSRLEMEIFVRSALGTEELAAGLADRAADESGGNPGLLEQLLRLYATHGVLVARTGASWWFDHKKAQDAVLSLPPEQAAVARVLSLDGTDREVLGRAATLGTSFWTGAVVALGRMGNAPADAEVVFAPDPSIPALEQRLQGLADRDFLVRLPSSTVRAETEWSFCRPEERTAVLAAVDSEILRKRRRFAAQWMEARCHRKVSSERLEMIALLYEEGGDEARAGRRLVSAAEVAIKRLRFERARALLLRAVRLLDLDDAQGKMEAYHSLGSVAARLGRGREALAHFQAMLELAWRMDLPAKGGAAHARIGRLHRAHGDLTLALRHLDLAHLLFDLAGDRRGIAATLDDIGRVHLLRGNYEEAATFHRGALSIREELNDARGRALTLSWLGVVELSRGHLSAAESCFRSALELARAARDGHSIVFSLLDLGRLEREAGRPDSALELLEEARGLARDMGERLYECHIGLQIGEALLAQGRGAIAEAELFAVRDVARSFGARRLEAEAVRGLAEVRLLMGDSVGARDRAYEALALAEKIEAAPLRASALRVLATAVAHGAPGDVEHGGPREMFDRAVEVLEGLGADLELGRTLTAYAEFEEATGRDDAASELRHQADDLRNRMVSEVAMAAEGAAR